MAILGVMLLDLVALYLRRSPKGEGNLPRTPDTVAAVWSYVCGSVMLDDFADLATLGTKERDRWVEGWGSRFGMGWERGVDGVSRWKVDYDSGKMDDF